MTVSQIQRKHPRFATDVKVSFSVTYDFKTEVDFQIEREKKAGEAHTYLGFTRNISAEGVCFESPKKLKSGDFLWIELHLPAHNQIIYMEGQVRWSKLSEVSPNAPHQYATGVRILKVDGKEVDKTIYFDEAYKVTWSELLERVLGSFAKLNRNK